MSGSGADFLPAPAEIREKYETAKKCSGTKFRSSRNHDVGPRNVDGQIFRAPNKAQLDVQIFERKLTVAVGAPHKSVQEQSGAVVRNATDVEEGTRMSINLPKDIKSEGMKAVLHNGELKVSIPRVVSVKVAVLDD